MIVFEYTHTIAPNTLIRHCIDEDSNLYAAIEAFGNFLRAAGYVFDGSIVLEKKPNAID